MKKNFGKGIILLIALFILFSTFGRVKVNNKPIITPVATPTPIVEVVEANILGDDFESNQLMAEKKWGGKLIEFSAKISNITESGLSFYNIGTKDFSMTQIACKVSDTSTLLDLKNGQTVKVRGTVKDQFVGVITVEDCKVIN